MNSQSANNQITINDLCEKLIRETIIKSARYINFIDINNGSSI